jgi:hypothetical protein
MRKQVTRAGVLGVTLAGSLIAAAGCDDVSTGRPADPSGPVRLVRVLVQDAPANVDKVVGEGGSTRNGAVDLLDGSPPVACADDSPCKVLMAFGGGLGDYTCRNGFCNDPFKAPPTGVPLNPDIDEVPAMPAMPPMPPKPPDPATCTPAQPATPATPATEAIPGVPGVSVRIILSKLLDASKVTSDGTALLPGVVDLIDESTGDKIPFDQLNGIWDPAGAPEFTSDPILSPFGPAIQISPMGLIHANKYTVVIHPGLIQDRNGNPLADQNGNLLKDDLKLSFSSEDVAANVTVGSFVAVTPYQLPGDFTPVFGEPPTMYQNDVLQLAFWEEMDIDSFHFVITGPDGKQMTTVEKYYESAEDPDTHKCPAELSTTMQINLANTTVPGTPAPWPVGTYKLVFAANSTVDGTSTFRSSMWPGADKDGALTFQVVEPPADNSPDTDTSIIDLHPLPEHCPCL